MDADGSLLGGVGLGDFDDGDTTLLGGSILGHIEAHRLGVDDITVGGLDLHQRIAGAVLQRFGGDQVAVLVGVEGVDLGNFGIGEGLLHQSAIGVVDLEGCACVGDGLAGLGIHLDDLQEGFKGGVVD